MLKGRTIYHCHGAEAGKPLHTYETKAKAEAAHRAIMASKERRKKKRAAAAYQAWKEKS